MHTARDTSHRSASAFVYSPGALLREEHDAGQTIIGVPFESPHPLRSMLSKGEAANDVPERTQRLFTIRAANSLGQRSSASILINRMYAARGYRCSGLPVEASSDKITLTACEHDDVMGTITVGFDSLEGLAVDQLFRNEVDALRRKGRVCEFTKLAMDSLVRSKRVLASLFHVAYIFAHRFHRVQRLLIEVNPRHVRFYRKALGFTVMGPERLNRRVDAPAVLLRLELRHARQQIDLHAGKNRPDAGAHSLYPHFFSAKEEAGILNRLPRPWWAQAA